MDGAPRDRKDIQGNTLFHLLQELQVNDGTGR